MSLTLYPLGDYIQLLQRKNLQLEFSGAPLTRESPGQLRLPAGGARHPVHLQGGPLQGGVLQSAKEQGAFAYLSEKRYDQVDLPCILVSDVRLAMALLADFTITTPRPSWGWWASPEPRENPPRPTT